MHLKAPNLDLGVHGYDPMRPEEKGMGEKSSSRRQQAGFTLIELLIVVAIIGIVSTIAIPQLLTAYRKAKITRLLAEVNGFQRALVEYSIDNSIFPLKSEFDNETLEPLIRDGYLRVNAITRLCRDNEIHKYDFDPDKGKALKWHLHPKLKPYDDGTYKVVIEGDGSSFFVKYLGSEMGPSEFLALVR